MGLHHRRNPKVLLPLRRHIVGPSVVGRFLQQNRNLNGVEQLVCKSSIMNSLIRDYRKPVEIVFPEKSWKRNPEVKTSRSSANKTPSRRRETKEN